MSEVHNKETNEHAVAGATPSADDMPAVKKPAARKRKAAEPVAEEAAAKAPATRKRKAAEPAADAPTDDAVAEAEAPALKVTATRKRKAAEPAADAPTDDAAVEPTAETAEVKKPAVRKRKPVVVEVIEEPPLKKVSTRQRKLDEALAEKTAEETDDALDADGENSVDTLDDSASAATAESEDAAVDNAMDNATATESSGEPDRSSETDGDDGDIAAETVAEAVDAGVSDADTIDAAVRTADAVAAPNPSDQHHGTRDNDSGPHGGDARSATDAKARNSTIHGKGESETDGDGRDAKARNSDNHDDGEEEAIGFSHLGLNRAVTDELAKLGYEEPTPIQAAAIPAMLQGKDVLGQAATGTGKTAAFALPLLHRFANTDLRGIPSALVLVPTRELAMQVSEAVHRYGRGLRVEVLPIYGGQPIGRQLQVLRRGVDVVVATPGRAIDHINRGSLDLQHIDVVVLDEADEMLDMGFAEDLEAILSSTPDTRQTVLFSATMPPRIAKLAKRHMTKPMTIEIERDRPQAGEAPLIRQVAYIVHRSHKPAALGRLLDVEAPTAAIVFCRTRVEVDQLAETLNGRGYRCEPLHGGLNQEQRDRVMQRVRNGTAELLVATDVAARGLDIDLLTHVVNYDVPSAPEAYVHRIGRVGRAGREGVAITLAEPRENRLLRNIERETGQRIRIEKVPSVEDLRSKQIQQTVANLTERLERQIDDHTAERFQRVVDQLSETHDLMSIATAAIALAHESEVVVEDLVEIPDATIGAPNKKKGAFERDRGDRGDRGGRFERGERGDRGGRFERGDRSERGGRFERDRPERGDRDSRYDAEDRGRRTPPAQRQEIMSRPPAPGKARLFVSAGHDIGLRPGDVVGAIANECDLSGADIGPILISERFTLVEIPDGAAGEVVSRLRRTTMRGQEVKVRRDRFGDESDRSDGPPSRGPRRSDDRFGDRGDRGPRRSEDGFGERSERPDRGPRPTYGKPAGTKKPHRKGPRPR